MKIEKVTRRATEAPLIVADVNGKILFMNDGAFAVLRSAKIGDNISKLKTFDTEFVQKLTMYENKTEIVPSGVYGYKTAVVRVVGAGLSKLLEIRLYNDESINIENLNKDKKLFASYFNIANDDVIMKLDLNKYIEEVVRELKSDFRFEYRKIEITGTEELELSTYSEHLSALVIASIVILNEINYKNTIRIATERILDKVSLSLSVEADTASNCIGERAITELYPGITLRLAYLSTLCRDDDTQVDFRIENNEFKISFKFDDISSDKTNLRFTSRLSIADFVSYVVSLFAYNDMITTGEEEQERE